MGPGTKLLGSGILNFGTYAAQGYHKLRSVGQDDPP